MLQSGTRFSKGQSSRFRGVEVGHHNSLFRLGTGVGGGRYRGHGRPRKARGDEEWAMTILKWALIFLVVSIIAGLLGFTGISAASADIARFLFYVFVVIFLVLLILGLTIFRV
jgi:uncharacterized membrane protein YtjA (UPF0391 family)